MKGNAKLGITAEMAAFIRDKEGVDKFSKYFVTKRVRRIYSIVSKIMPKRKLGEIFKKRVELSKEINKIILEFKPEQIIELASGSCVHALEFLEKYPKMIYIESDLEENIKKKEKIVRDIEEIEGLNGKNHYFIDIDVVRDDIYDKVKKYIDKNKRTLIFSEGLNSYLDEEQYEKLTRNVLKFCRHMKKVVYLSHDQTKEGESITSGTSGKALRGFISAITGSKKHVHYRNLEDMKEKFESWGFKAIKTKECGKGNLIYLVERK